MLICRVTPSLRTGLALLVLLLGALWLRTRELDQRPMHADEANQAVKLGHLLETGRYRFDPLDHHGPTLYYFGLLPAWFRGETNLASLTETTVRLTPALFGTVAVWLVFLLGRPLGRTEALAAAAFVAVSPAAVYYGRYFIQETLLVTFTLAAMACGQCWWRTLRTRWVIAVGVCAGLMLATKATAVLLIGPALLALLVARPAWRKDFRGTGRALVLAAGSAAVVAVLFYSSFLTHPGGLRDAFTTFGPGAIRAAGGESGHEKPWWYYASLFLRTREGGYLWDQSAFLALAAVGLLLALRPSARATLRFHAAYLAILAIALSLVPYKTPWIVVNLVPALALLAGAAIGAIARVGSAVLTRPPPTRRYERWIRLVAAAIVFAIVAAWQTRQTWQTAFTRPADPRNPLAYVHSAPDVLKIPALAKAARAAHPDEPIKVISDEYWPLPWYLRRYPRVGYWSEPPADCDGALVIAGVDQYETVRERLRRPYREGIIGLRPGVVLVTFTPDP